MKKLISSIFLSLLFLTPLLGQQNEADYERAKSFMRDSLFNKIYHLSVNPNWSKDSNRLIYKANTAKGYQYYLINVKSKTKELAFDSERLVNALNQITEENNSTKDLNLQHLKIESNHEFSFYFKGKKYQVNSENHQVKTLSEKKSTKNESIAPNEKQSVFIKNGNLHLRNKQNNQSNALTKDGSDYYIYGSYYGWDQIMEGESTPPEPRLTATWSSDSKKVLTQIMDARNAEKMYLLDFSIDSLYRPKLLSYYRGSPADTTVIKYKPVLFDTTSQKRIDIDIEPLPHFIGLSLDWISDNQYLYGLYYHRGYQQLDIIEINANTGKSRTVFSDYSDTRIEYKTQFRYIEKEGFALITSERDGWNHLYKIDWKNGKAKQLTHGNFVVKEIKAIDEKNKIIYFTATGKDSKVNPYYLQLYKMDFEGNNLELLTKEPQNHDVFISPDMKYFVDNISTVQDPTVSQLKSTKNGEILFEIEQADISELTQKNWNPPYIETVKARDGKTDIYVAIWRPTNFDPNKKYPIIDYTYSGPHTFIVPNSFSKVAWPYAYADVQALAELGFIIVNIDGLGSVGRSKEFHDWSYKKLGDNMKDHALAIQQLSKRYPWIDGNRVGVFGHSAGGYDAAHALLTLNDTYKVAVSVAADHDWRMEKAWWPEMYAGWPVGDYYDAQSNVNLASNLKGKLLLIHGAIDENVNPSATYKLAEALIKADKYFDLLIVPSGRHGLPKEYELYLAKKRWDFFIEHLINNPSKD